LGPGQSWQTSARAEIGDVARRAELRDLEPGEGVGDVHAHDVARIVDRGRRG